MPTPTEKRREPTTRPRTSTPPEDRSAPSDRLQPEAVGHAAGEAVAGRHLGHGALGGLAGPPSRHQLAADGEAAFAERVAKGCEAGAQPVGRLEGDQSVGVVAEPGEEAAAFAGAAREEAKVGELADG